MTELILDNVGLRQTPIDPDYYEAQVILPLHDVLLDYILESEEKSGLYGISAIDVLYTVLYNLYSWTFIDFDPLLEIVYEHLGEGLEDGEEPNVDLLNEAMDYTHEVARIIINVSFPNLEEQFGSTRDLSLEGIIDWDIEFDDYEGYILLILAYRRM